MRLHDRLPGVVSPSELPGHWREQAADLRRFGADHQAQTLEICAEELERTWRSWQAEPLNLQAAADESGYSADHLGRLIRQGAIPNAGCAGAPLIRRCDLPIKQQRTHLSLARSDAEADSSTEQIVQSIINEGAG